MFKYPNEVAISFFSFNQRPLNCTLLTDIRPLDGGICARKSCPAVRLT